MAANDDLFELFLRHPDIVKQPNHAGEAEAWCPFHDDKGGRTPNLRINVSKRIVKCFVCNNGGAKKLARAWGIESEPAKEARSSPKDPFMSAEAAMQALADNYGLRAGTIAHFRIEAVENMPSPSRSSRGAWRYPTHAGNRMKAFDRQSKPKYWWSRGTDSAKIASELYGQRDIPAHTPVVYRVNGEPSVWVCWQAGINAVCSFGEANLNSASVNALHDHGVRQVRIVLDLDEAGEKGAFRDIRLFREAGIEAKAYRLPSYLGDKGDVSDLYIWHKKDDAVFKSALEQLPEFNPQDPDPLSETKYSISDNRIFVQQSTRDGEIDVPLTNFVAWATGQILRDDGLTPETNLSIQGKLATGAPLPAIEVPLAEFESMKWIHHPTWGITPIIKAGASSKDQVREVFQHLSNGKGLTQRTVYTHTGWRKLDDGRWRFLMPFADEGSGDGVEVELESANYDRYRLPATPESPMEAVKASLRFLDVGDPRVSIPLLMYMYLAPLQSILNPSFVLWLRARTGSFKSTLAALACCHFGQFESGTPPVTWQATSRGLERMLFDLKDAPLWVDDFAPQPNPRDFQILNHKAEEVIRSFGNRQGRVRMSRSTKAQNGLPPRALLLSTAEIYPSGTSVLARTLPIDFSINQVDRDQMTLAQQESDLYPHAMAAYVGWVGRRYDDLAKKLPQNVTQFRDIAYDDSAHARISQATAIMLTTTDLVMDFAQDIGAIDLKRAIEIQTQARWVYSELAVDHTKRVSETDPVTRFLNVIDTMLSQGKVEIAVRGTHAQPYINVDRIGWYDSAYVYLDAEGAYNRVARWLRDENRNLGLDDAGLRQALLENGILAPKEEGHLASRVMVNGRRHRVLRLHREMLPFNEALSDSAPPPPPESGGGIGQMAFD